MKDAISPEERLRRASRIQEFLNDEIIDHVFRRLERKYYEEFKKSKSAEERARTQGKANVLDDLLLEMKIVLDDGEMVVQQIAKQAVQEERDRTHMRT